MSSRLHTHLNNSMAGGRYGEALSADVITLSGGRVNVCLSDRCRYVDMCSASCLSVYENKLAAACLSLSLRVRAY